MTTVSSLRVFESLEKISLWAKRPQWHQMWKSLVSDSGISNRAQSPLVRSPGFIDLAPVSDDGIDGRFFHASDAPTIKPATKKSERKMAVGFFYADGQQEETKSVSPRATSPVLSAVSEKRSSGPWVPNPSRSPPMLSPALSNLSERSPFFAAATGQPKPRSPSPSKENIHLSYRKGASQIFGSRPSPIPTPRTSDGSASDAQPRRGSLEPNSDRTPHRKTPSLSSIDSGNSHQSRRRSATTLDPVPTPSPLNHEIKAATIPRIARSPTHLPSIDTSLGPSDSQMTLSPTKSISELAADARRERKVLDLEISNSSLLAINGSLEREVRRQKTELKRFRRLSRAGRLSYAPAARLSEGLSALGEEEADDGFAAFGPPSGFTDVYDDFSDDETESITSGCEPLSPTSRSSKEHDRLLKDERRLQADMEKHKELLVQSQMMNQSLKRCTLATEDMIKEGKKALDHEIRVSDVRLGGRILRGDDDEAEDIEVEDETLHGEDQMESAKGFLDVWQGVGSRGGNGSLEGSEGGDRDSGIEVDKPPLSHELPTLRSLAADSGRPPDEALLGAERPKLHWLHSIS